MANTETAGGTRFSTGKAIQTWAPLLGLGLVWDVADQRNEKFESGCGDDATLDTADQSMRLALGNPLARDEDGDLEIAVAAYVVLDLLHEKLTGDANAGRPTQGLDPVFQVSQMGAKKYAPLDYRRGQSFSTLLSSGYRHLRAAHAFGWNAMDSESGLFHLGHFLWNALCLLEFIATERYDLDDVTPWRDINTAQRKAAEEIAAREGRPLLEVLRDFHYGAVELVEPTPKAA